MYYEVQSQRSNKVRLKYRTDRIIGESFTHLTQMPTKSNYMQAMKLMTINSMIGQIADYQSLMGEERNVDIPKSCQSPENGGTS